MCSGSAEPSIRLAGQILAGQLKKFCDHAICCNAPTLNNSQNLNLDFGSEFLNLMNLSAQECRQMPNFRSNKNLRKLGKEYLDVSLCEFVVYCLQHSKTVDVSHVFLPLAVAELATLKQVCFFGSPCIKL